MEDWGLELVQADKMKKRPASTAPKPSALRRVRTTKLPKVKRAKKAKAAELGPGLIKQANVKVDKTKILCGSVCSGLATDKFGADKVLGKDLHQQVISCEVDPQVRSITEQNCNPIFSFGDVRHPDFMKLAPVCDVPPSSERKAIEFQKLVR